MKIKLFIGGIFLLLATTSTFATDLCTSSFVGNWQGNVKVHGGGWTYDATSQNVSQGGNKVLMIMHIQGDPTVGTLYEIGTCISNHIEVCDQTYDMKLSGSIEVGHITMEGGIDKPGYNKSTFNLYGPM